MADTTLVIDGRTVTISGDAVLNDSQIQQIRKDIAASTEAPYSNTATNYHNHQDNNSSNQMEYIFFGGFILYVIIMLRSAMLSKDKYIVLRGSCDTDEQYIDDVQQCREEASREYYLYKGDNLNINHQDMETILNKYCPYYKNLNQPLQFRFFDRLRKFMHSKEFLIYSNEPFKEMPVLISAAAVQISFGLEDYELPHYQYIQVRKEEYFAENSLRVLAGNVEDNSITLAWNQLLKGYADTEDGSNVGLHEMAHALYYQEIIVDNSKEETFAGHFNLILQDGASLLQQKQCPYQLYTNYAFTNVQEFWAVSVELFFEKAHQLEKAYPTTFNHLQELLRQNPLIPNQPVALV